MRTYRIRQLAALAATIALIGCTSGTGTSPKSGPTGGKAPAAGGQTSSRMLRKKPSSLPARSAPTRPAVAPKTK